MIRTPCTWQRLGVFGDGQPRKADGKLEQLFAIEGEIFCHAPTQGIHGL